MNNYLIILQLVDRFSRPSIGGRSRLGARTTASPEAAPAAAEEEVVAPKEVKPVSSGFARGRRKSFFLLDGYFVLK